MTSHVDQMQQHVANGRVHNGKSLLDRVEGRFYTHELAGRHLVRAIASAFATTRIPEVRIIEPFCGDGRLVSWLLEELVAAKKLWKRQRLDIHLWDSDASVIHLAEQRVLSTAETLRVPVRVKATHGDSFHLTQSALNSFHVCVTNPPWENLKPDSRELQEFSEKEKAHYINLLRDRDKWLSQTFALSRPKAKFSGWGTNLARCGVEAAFRLTCPQGVCGVVSPASVLADQVSIELRKWLFTEQLVCDIAYYVAEARLFDKVDQASITLVGQPGTPTTTPPALTIYDRNHKGTSVTLQSNEWADISENAFAIPMQFGISLISLSAKLKHLPTFGDMEGTDKASLWAGRELDETSHKEYLVSKGSYLFTKGRMIQRFGLAEHPSQYVSNKGPVVPASADHYRLVWRDVSRPNQKRRIHATIIPPGWVTGNSLHVAYFRDDNLVRLQALLGVVNSYVFEWLARSQLATGHVSLGAVRRVQLFPLTDDAIVAQLAGYVLQVCEGNEKAATKLEVTVAQLYGLTRDDFSKILGCFDKVTSQEKDELTHAAEWNIMPPVAKNDTKVQMTIPNHYAPNLSKLDMDIVRSVPPGGNWKNIPTSVPSQRLAQIRESFSRGEGSRSTYYGRLRSDAPAYTINTYFSRPGNGCHIHYAQDRTLSQREAARLQSFPDNFCFLGPKTRINQQIGNAVPPLLAYQIAKALSVKGMCIDMFSGAGGLSLGFLWAGWQLIAANDIDPVFLTTYKANIHDQVVLGDIRDPSVFSDLVRLCNEAKVRHPHLPLFVLGGPPCQGFSTAGNRRSMKDDRNWLFQSYKSFLEKVRPAGFVFENVTGLMNIEQGRVYELILRELTGTVGSVSAWKLNAEEHAIPQRRTRLILVGSRDTTPGFQRPPVLTQTTLNASLFSPAPPIVTVADAISDLPSVEPGEDGSNKPYRSAPTTAYQNLMRAHITPAQYLQQLQVEQE